MLHLGELVVIWAQHGVVLWAMCLERDESRGVALTLARALTLHTRPEAASLARTEQHAALVQAVIPGGLMRVLTPAALKAVLAETTPDS